MSEKIFVDTSGFFAFLNKSDVNHREAARRFQASARKITSNYVFDELMTLMTARGEKELSIRCGDELRSGRDLVIHFLSSSEEEKAWQTYKKYRDHDLSFTDATTLVLLCSLKIFNLLSFDDSFLKLSQGIVPFTPKIPL